MATPDQAFKGWVEYGAGGGGGGGGNAFIQGGNTFGATAVLGTNDAFGLHLETSGSVRARITDAGVFLIAAAAPSGTESLRVSGGGILNDGTQSITSVTSTLSLNNSGGPINIGNNANAQAINIGTGAAARTVTIGNQTGATSVIIDAGTGPINIGDSAQARSVNIATGVATQAVAIGNAAAGTSVLLRAPTINLAASTALQVNGSAGAAGQVLTSQGPASPAIWTAISGSPLVLVSTATLAGVNSATIAGLDGDTDGIYFIHGQIIVTGAVGSPATNVILRPNAVVAGLYSTATGLTTGGVTVTNTGAASNSWFLHGANLAANSTESSQLSFEGWIAASATYFAGPAVYGTTRSITGTSSVFDSSVPRSASALFQGQWAVSPSVNLTSMQILATQAGAVMTGKVSIYRLSRT